MKLLGPVAEFYFYEKEIFVVFSIEILSDSIPTSSEGVSFTSQRTTQDRHFKEIHKVATNKRVMVH